MHSAKRRIVFLASPPLLHQRQIFLARRRPPSARWHPEPTFCSIISSFTSLSDPSLEDRACFGFTSPADRRAIFILEGISDDSRIKSGLLLSSPACHIHPAAVNGGQIPVCAEHRQSFLSAGNPKKNKRKKKRRQRARPLFER